MHGAEKGLNELCGMLKVAEADIKKSSGHVMAIQNKPNFKKKGNSWKKRKGKAKDTIPKPNPPESKDGLKAKGDCFHCGKNGHWKRNCKEYLASLKDKEGGGKGTSATCTLVVYVIDIFLANSYMNSWVFDTGSVAHICNTM